jgi:ATP-dependent Clp protease ATP-binding subunit ClpA
MNILKKLILQQEKNNKFVKNIANSFLLKHTFEVECRQKEISLIGEILLRKYKKNCILVGEEGVGKNTTVFLFAQKIAYKDVPLPLLNKKIFLVDFLEIINAAKNNYDIEDMLYEIFSTLISKKNAIIYLKNLHNFIGIEEDHEALSSVEPFSSNYDFSIILKSILTKSQHSIIATTLSSIYKQTERSHSWIKHNFVELEIMEPGFLKTYRIVEKHKPALEAFHNITINENALYKVIMLSKKYNLNLKFPQKALALLDSCAAKIVSFITWQKNFNPIEAHLFNLLKKTSAIKFEILRSNDFEALLNIAELEFLYTKILKKFAKKKYIFSKQKNISDFLLLKADDKIHYSGIKFFLEKQNEITSKIISGKKNKFLISSFNKKIKNFSKMSFYNQTLEISNYWLSKSSMYKSLLVLNKKNIKNLYKIKTIIRFLISVSVKKLNKLEYNSFNILYFVKKTKNSLLKTNKIKNLSLFLKGKQIILNQEKFHKNLDKFLKIFKSSKLSAISNSIINYKNFSSNKNIFYNSFIIQQFKNKKLQDKNIFLKKTVINRINNELNSELAENFVFDILNISKPKESQGVSAIQKLLNLERKLKEKVAGQEEAVSAVSNAMRRAKLGLRSFDRPIASFFFCGPTGVGKTEIAKALSFCMYGSEDQLIRFDMSEYMEKHAMSRLVGAPAGYVGYEDGGQLTNVIAKNPHAIVLFDEIEKAHSDISYLLLQVLDDGRLTDSKKNIVRFENTIIIMTSNAAAEDIEKSINDFNKQKDKIFAEIEQQKQKFKETQDENNGKNCVNLNENLFLYFNFLKTYNLLSYKVDISKKLNLDLNQSKLKSLNKFKTNFKRVLNKNEYSVEINKFKQLEETLSKELQSSVYNALSASFAPEFLNRIDNIIIFRPLSENDLKVIAKLFLNKLINQYKKQQIDLILDSNVLNKLVEACYEPKYGARPLRRGITKYIEDLIIEKIIKLNLNSKDGLNFVIGLNKNSAIAIKQVYCKKKKQQISFF